MRSLALFDTACSGRVGWGPGTAKRRTRNLQERCSAGGVEALPASSRISQVANQAGRARRRTGSTLTRMFWCTMRWQGAEWLSAAHWLLRRCFDSSEFVKAIYLTLIGAPKRPRATRCYRVGVVAASRVYRCRFTDSDAQAGRRRFRCVAIRAMRGSRAYPWQAL